MPRIAQTLCVAAVPLLLAGCATSGSEQDGRVTYLSITESGRQLSQVHNTEFFAQLAPLVADISDADAACTVQTIEKIYKIMSERKNSLEHR